ncbi:4-hydroxythreonine-4-phosphate dehydrogenase [Stappia aggregata IAM 12614]|uniref:4-hydroxythreonine-4-phosphate dehydrogenase n=1 Tax=Roseibium aggregatum (strain ATCC 25650 / DSM 13394 / JCM 20685 / NBRC 16684 / NCIMB 2208 / IAM 12614 / B1) TaxID=384765 RepID=A0NMV8_ROSAI|nr:4-hydroxythreonine-4-phosphate dehydrogenase PdxA [Roseibium aggregatum]EAV46403.1 4-hydroxythreonine-4-phosphate dehydrogenase [Stappia aggregata IAM 12614] [Roseibium aggregatum IAM 12614]
MRSNQKPIAVSMGEPAGIGPDLALIAWANRKALGLPPFYIRGDEALLQGRAQRMGLNARLKMVAQDEAAAVFPKALPIVQTGPALSDQPGVEAPETAASVVSAIEGCVEDIKSGVACALVTNPINKAALYRTGFAFPGHTEYLGALAKKHWPGEPAKPVMMIAGPELMVVPVTIHIPLRDVPSALTTDLIVETAEITANDLGTRFGYASPRLAICGLNPHAGENGSIGTEERDVIEPAIARLRALGINASGPHSADTLFHPPARQQYDCVLGMYHDQVLIPAKTIGFDDSVNVTLGLPFVRTSPDHGTAYDLAGSGTARVDSFAASLRMADVLANPDRF